MIDAPERPISSLVDAARTAHDEGRWKDAREDFQAAEARGHVFEAEDLERYGTAELFEGAAPAVLERAFRAYEDAGRAHDAARVGVELAAAHAVRGNSSLAMGWARRAERGLEGQPEGPGHAHVVGVQGLFAAFAGRIDDAIELNEQARRLARAHGNPDAEASALNRRARLYLRTGRVEEAKADLDEAMLLVHEGRVRPLAAAMIYCNTIDVCRDMSDYERAFEWTEAASAWISERRVWCFPGVCRVHRAELLRIRGEHERATVEVEAALELFDRMQARGMVGEALTELGQQRLERDDLDGAEEAFRGAQEAGHHALPGAAMLQLRRGDVAGAHSTLATALDERAGNPLGRAVLLPALVEASIAIGDLDEARRAIEELERTAALIGTVGLRASADAAAARLHLAEGQARPALVRARAASRAWNLVGACFELLRSREVLADAYAQAGDPTRAEVERASARSQRDALATGSSADAPPIDPAATQALEDLPTPFTGVQTIRPGVVIDDKIEVGPVLGVGGMGVVHEGRHRLTGRDLAIKALQRVAAHDEHACERFLQEALACGRIRHPNVVDIYDAGLLGREPYIVMERLQGEPLSRRIERGPILEPARALVIGEQVARGVAAAHAVGIIHRDLKPDNIFVRETDDGTIAAKVLDFGLSVVMDAGRSRSGRVVGTPFYMAPEQITAPDSVDERTDVYALGVVLFEMLTGRPPFDVESIHALMIAITSGEVIDLARHRPDLGEEVVGLVNRAMCRDPAGRFSSATELADTLAQMRA